MKVFRNREECTLWSLARTKEGKTVGFIPTMGALHQGHMSLIKAAKESCGAVIASVYVNPTQFNNAQDLLKYPRTPQADLELLQANGCDAVFMPSDSEIYPEGVKTATIDLGGLDKTMEGASRPGHFAGVVSVVSTLLDIVKPDKAFFGEKDFQQLAIIRRMAEQLHIPCQIVGCPIFRQGNGLAFSSRNARLNEEQKNAAPLIYKTLLEIKSMWGSHPIEDITNFATQNIEGNPLFQVEYLTVAEEKTMQVIETQEQMKKGETYYAFIVVHAGGVRLIDNIRLN